MGLRGPPPKLTSQKILEGNPGKQKLNMNEPSFSGTVTASDIKPSSKLTAAEQKFWKAKIKAIGTSAIRETDIPALTSLVKSEARMAALLDKIESIGPLVKTGDGSVKTNPLVRQLDQERRWAISLWGRFGHTPADRSRLVEEVSAKDKAKSGILSGEYFPSPAAKREPKPIVMDADDGPVIQ